MTGRGPHAARRPGGSTVLPLSTPCGQSRTAGIGQWNHRNVIAQMKNPARVAGSQHKTDANLSGDGLLLATAQHDQAANEQHQSTSGGGEIDLGGLGSACNHGVS
jgi:hypothetical protein